MTSFLLIDASKNGKNQEGGQSAHNIGVSWPGSEESHTYLRYLS